MVARKSRPRAPREPDIAVKVDASLKRRYDKLLAEVTAAQHKGASAFDALWEAVGAIVEHDPPLYAVAGYRNDAEFFEECLGESRRTAYRSIRIAKFASPRDEEKYGGTRLDAALTYLEAKLGSPLEHPPLPVAFDRLKIPVQRDAKTARVSLEDASPDEIRAATRALSKAPKRPTSSLERAIKEALSGHPALADSRVRVRGGIVHFTGVPAAAIGVFLAAMGTVKWETRAEVGAKKKIAPKTARKAVR